MQNAILVLHMIISVVLVGAVLMQRSEGGALGMGGGGTGGLISGRGAADMMVNITSWVGGAFFVTSVFLAVLASSQPTDRSVIQSGGEKPGFNFTIPGFPKPAVTTPAPVPAPAPVGGGTQTTLPSDSVLAPAPVEALTRAGPLDTQPVATAPVGAVRVAPPAASLPAPTVVGGTPKTTTAPRPPVTAAKTTATAPMIPLPPAATPAPATESAQPPAPAPTERQKAGPDE